MTIVPILFGTGMLLGLGLPLARWLAPQGVDPVAFALWPTAAAGAVLAVLAHTRGCTLLAPGHLRFGAIAALGGYALPMTVAFWLAGRAGAGAAAIAFTLPPLFTLAFHLLLGRGQWRWRQATGIALGLAGAALLVLQTGAGTRGDAQALIAVFVIPALIGATNVYRSLHMPPGAHAATLGALTLCGAGLMLALVALATGEGAVPFSAPVLGGLGLQAVALVAGYLLYFELQKRADPVVFSLMGYVMMVTSALLGIVVLDEAWRWMMVPAALLILTGIRMVAR